eukprot:13993347-Heterocapsa_arctica.AAC.1
MAWIVQQRLIEVGEATFGLEKPEHKVKAQQPDRAEAQVVAQATRVHLARGSQHSFRVAKSGVLKCTA